MILTEDNYFSSEAQAAYMGSSQFKAFDRCEAATLAEIRGEYAPEKSTALLVGSYVDAYFSGTLESFKSQNPDIFKRDGSLKAEYLQADGVIRRIERDPMFMRYISGEHQVIRTGEIAGVPFKIKMDSYHPGRAIVDMKIMRDFLPVYAEGKGRIPFAEAWGYDIQGAIYRAVEGNGLPFILAAATKEKEPDIALLAIPEDVLDTALEYVESKAPRFAAIKAGAIQPERCGHCDYCKATKVLDTVVDYRDV